MKKICTTVLFFLSFLCGQAYAISIDTTVPSVSISGLNKVVNILPGGVVTGNVSGSGLYHTINLSGGTVGGNISFSGFEHEFNFNSGALGGNLTFSGFDHIVNFMGGDIGAGTSGSGERHIFNFIGSGFSSTKAVGSLISGVSTITGMLADNTFIDYDISIGGTYTVNFIDVSEPSMFILLLGVLGLMARSRRAL